MQSINRINQLPEELAQKIWGNVFDQCVNEVHKAHWLHKFDKCIKQVRGYCMDAQSLYPHWLANEDVIHNQYFEFLLYLIQLRISNPSLTHEEVIGDLQEFFRYIELEEKYMR